MTTSLATIFASLIIAAAILVAAHKVASAIAPSHRESPAADTLRVLRLFAPAIATAQQDPRALLVWEPIAATARRLYPDAFADLDRAGGGRFPFTTGQIEAAHARWTTDWLAWERSHDAEFKLKSASVEQELATGAADARDRLETLEREKLETYQRRYQEYVQVSKALQALTKPR